MRIKDQFAEALTTTFGKVNSFVQNLPPEHDRIVSDLVRELDVIRRNVNTFLHAPENCVSEEESDSGEAGDGGPR